jgi:magnesium transporter
MEFRKPHKSISKLNRKKHDPEKYVFTGIPNADKIDIQLFRFNKDKCHESKGISPDTIGNLDNNAETCWLNIYGLKETEIIASICEKQGIHNLVIQDILDVNQRPKFQEFEKFSFLTLKSIVPAENKLLTEQISIVFGTNFLISFQERKADFSSTCDSDSVKTRAYSGKGDRITYYTHCSNRSLIIISKR